MYSPWMIPVVDDILHLRSASISILLFVEGFSYLWRKTFHENIFNFYLHHMLKVK